MFALAWAITGLASDYLCQYCFVCAGQTQFDSDAVDSSCTELLSFSYTDLSWTSASTTSSLSVQWDRMSSGSSEQIFSDSLATFTLGTSIFQDVGSAFANIRACFGISLTLLSLVLFARVFQCCLLPCHLRPEPEDKRLALSAGAQVVVLTVELIVVVVGFCAIVFFAHTGKLTSVALY